MSEKDRALNFANSMRGRYILSQALYHAIKTMKAVPAPHTEVSNIADMEYLYDNLFPMFKLIEHLDHDPTDKSIIESAVDDVASRGGGKREYLIPNKGKE